MRKTTIHLAVAAAFLFWGLDVAAQEAAGDSASEGLPEDSPYEELQTGEQPASTPAAQPAPSVPSGSPAETQPSAEPEKGVEGQVTSEAIKEVDTGTYSVKLRDLEERINILKEQIFKAKARLSLLAETVLDRKIAGAKAVITHHNEMGSSFKMAKAVFSLDGAPVFNKIDEDGSLSDRETLELFNGNIVPGDHTISVLIEYQGHGFGIFSYLKGYKFRVRSSHTFTASEGRTIHVKIVGYEQGGVTTSLEERPALKFLEQVSSEGASKQAAEKGSEGN